MARSIIRFVSVLCLALPCALPAEPVAAPPVRVAGAASPPLAVGGDDEFRRAMLEWAPPASTASPSPTPLEGFVRLAAPLERMRPSSMFGVRIDPIDGQWRHHAGIDIPDQPGAPIHAAAEGVVVHAGWAGGYGNLVVIRHAGGMETRYGHLSRLLASMGQAVHQGQVIGLVGETGRATGNHLHFEVRSSGRPVDPQTALDAHWPAVSSPPRIADDPPPPIAAHGTGWQTDPNRLPSPAF